MFKIRVVRIKADNATVGSIVQRIFEPATSSSTLSTGYTVNSKKNLGTSDAACSIAEVISTGYQPVDPQAEIPILQRDFCTEPVLDRLQYEGTRPSCKHPGEQINDSCLLILGLCFPLPSPPTFIATRKGRAGGSGRIQTDSHEYQWMTTLLAACGTLRDAWG